MSVYVITGSLGAGKSLMTVSKLREYVKEGRRIAGNIDLDLEFLTQSKRSTATYVRVPDIPTAADLDLIGRGYEGDHDNDRNGALVLDECGVWLNSREWNDPRRKALIAWLLHARKKRWDVFLLVQDIDLIDSQVRKALCEYVVHCHAVDKIKVPVFSLLWRIFTGRKKLPLPRVHVAAVTLGRSDPQRPVKCDTWFTGSRPDLWKSYDTEQVFSDLYPHGPHSLLSPWHLQGRYMPPALTWRELLWRLPLWLFLQFCKLNPNWIVYPTGRIEVRRV